MADTETGFDFGGPYVQQKQGGFIIAEDIQYDGEISTRLKVQTGVEGNQANTVYSVIPTPAASERPDIENTQLSVVAMEDGTTRTQISNTFLLNSSSSDGIVSISIVSSPDGQETLQLYMCGTGDLSKEGDVVALTTPNGKIPDDLRADTLKTADRKTLTEALGDHMAAADVQDAIANIRLLRDVHAPALLQQHGEILAALHTDLSDHLSRMSHSMEQGQQAVMEAAGDKLGNVFEQARATRKTTPGLGQK